MVSLLFTGWCKQRFIPFAWWRAKRATMRFALRESAGAKRRQSPGLSMSREQRDHDEGNGWLAKGAAEDPQGLKPPD